MHDMRMPFGKFLLVCGVLLTVLLLTVGGCRRRDAEEAAAAPARSGSGVIDIMTGKAAVDAGEQAKDVIRETSLERRRQMDEVLTE